MFILGTQETIEDAIISSHCIAFKASGGGPICLWGMYFVFTVPADVLALNDNADLHIYNAIYMAMGDPKSPEYGILIGLWELAKSPVLMINAIRNICKYL